MKKALEIIITGLFQALGLRRVIIFFIQLNWNQISKQQRGKRQFNRSKKAKPRVFFGPVPVINNRYWSEALKEAGYSTETLMSGYYSINRKEDFDRYFEDILRMRNGWLPDFIKLLFKEHLVFGYILRNFDVVVIPFSGITKGTVDEARFLKRFGILSVVIPYGGDYWMYSKMIDNSYKYGLIANYPDYGRNEHLVRRQVEYWSRYGDCVLVSSQIDGASRWDSFPYSLLCLDLTSWRPLKVRSNADGMTGAVKIVHTPNHRYIKGTEFLLAAIERLISEGMKIEIVLLDKVSNDRVRQVLCEEADILVEKLTYSVYGLSGVEGMAAGVPVLSNLENENATRVFRRYSYLNECPLVSATPENIYEYLKALITNPALRSELGDAGRNYVAKYHSFDSFRRFFDHLVAQYWYGEEADIRHFFHPHNPRSFNNMSPRIAHPLVDNQLPDVYLK